MLKHLPEKSLKQLQETFLYSKKRVAYNKSMIYRRTYNSTTAAEITDDNLDDRIDKFQDQLKTNFSIEYHYDTLQALEKLTFH